MQRKTKQIGLMIGVMIMTAMAGTGTAFAAAGPAETEMSVTDSRSKVGENKTDKKAKKDSNQKKDSGQEPGTESQGKQENQNSGYYGRVKKAEKDKVTLEEAEIVQEKEDAAADFENDTVKWKLSGRTIEIKLDSDTKLYKEMISPKTDKKTQDKKQDSAEKNETKSKGIPLKKIRDGSLVKVTLRKDGSGIASEIMMLSGVKEVKAAKQGA